MIHTIRKHSKWLLWVVSGLVIFTFVVFMGAGPAGNRGSGGSENNTNASGEIYGQKITGDMYEMMRKDVKLDFLFNYGQWPDESKEVAQQLQQRIYVRMMLIEKAKQLGVHVTDEQAESVAANFLSSPSLKRALHVQRDQAISFNAFVNQVLAPQNMDGNDFENFIRNDLAIEQMQTLFGLSGQLLTPQEATNEFIRENQEYSAQVVFFSASNYLNRVSISPSDVGAFFTNYMADYRLPARVQVSYVLFSVTNYMSEATREVGATNLDLETQNAFKQYGMQATPDAKSTNEALAEIRNILLRQHALMDAVTQANIFAQSAFSIEPVSPQNLATVAKQKGLTVEHPAPFAADYGPSEFTAPPAFTQAAFGLTPDSPISLPVQSPNGVYIIALHTNLPSEIPPLEQIRDRVTEDLRTRLATVTAQRVGTNFAHQLPIQMAAGKSFSAVGFANGLNPLVLSPFSLSTQEIPELGNHATANQVKEAAFTTPVGTASGFMPTDDGGFILYVESRLPVDHEKMAAQLPQFTEELRGRRAEAAFQDWIQHEASRELRDTPLANQARAR
ncbi:MAG TPA: peptidylprolyl isomerase [Verrucomicrobiae bacterium]|jgi:peptidyl-prolyl cis-trans isomerase D|nr:peptidylprolyl isomerase [Verrucomicrobiae bacterium]